MRSREALESIFESMNYQWGDFTPDNFIAHIASQVRHRPIKLFGEANLPQPWCVSGPTMDFIFYSSTVGTMLQTHHKLHEVGHLVLGHVKTINFLGDEDFLELLDTFAGRFRSAVVSTDPQLISEENEAEYFVYLVRQKIHQYNRLHELTSISSRVDLFLPPFSGKLSK